MSMRSSSATSSPLAPPPPPPPPPPQLDLDEEVQLQQVLAKEAAARKKMDFREILALFHDRPRMDPVARERAWENLWQTTLAEAQEEHRQLRKNGGKGQQDDVPSRTGSGASSKHSGGGPEPPKRPRQVRSTICDVVVVMVSLLTACGDLYDAYRALVSTWSRTS